MASTSSSPLPPGAVDNSALAALREDPDAAANAPNQLTRQVFGGHFVQVSPTPLPEPVLVAHSPGTADLLGLDARSPNFAAFFSGDVGDSPAWATPYALSIYGSEMTSNCPFGTGNGYGDGRALSVAEIISPQGQRFELQLKGAGRTPFSRGGDGRAVLRSSVREFLASECMASLNVSTTRALSLVVSRSETVQRPWYSQQRRDAGDALAQLSKAQRIMYDTLPAEQKQQVRRELERRGQEPDLMQSEPCAITCRVAPSFLRIGHVELFARRANKRDAGSPSALEDLAALVDHAIFREYPELAGHGSPEERVVELFRHIAARCADLVADWLRVGYCQGNFNSDNALLGGRTMDYGPFGFMEKFYSKWNPWIGGGEHFSFLNQPKAMLQNLVTLASALLPLVQNASALNAALQEVPALLDARVAAMWRAKLGFSAEAWDAGGSELLQELLELLEVSEGDYTIFWRQLAAVADGNGRPALDDVFYASLTTELEARWAKWLDRYKALVSPDAGAAMRRVSPKYVPREWMLVDAYDAANRGDYALVHELQDVFSQPFAEQSSERAARFYRRRPDCADGRPGTAFMS